MDSIRVSCNAFVRLHDGYRRYALLGSRSKFESSGELSLKPIGGAIKATEDGLRFLIEEFKIRLDRPGDDLRFRMPANRLDDFRRWFNVGVGVEPDPAGREFREELGPDEHNLLTPSEAAACNFALWDEADPQEPSTRRGMEGVLTQYLFRVYEADVPREVLDKLVDLATNSDNLLMFVSGQQIDRRRGPRSSHITDACKYLK